MKIEQFHAQSPLTEQMDYARAVSTASMLPETYRGKPADIMLAVGLGQSMGLSPAESLYRISVIKGKPTASAELIAANVRKAGHKLRVITDEQAKSVKAIIVRADDPDFAFEVTRDMAWAQSMKLAGNDNYTKQPLTMLQWRAITAVARLACPEALYGVSYSPDEMQDDQAQQVTVQPTSAVDRMRQALRPEVTVEQVVEVNDEHATHPHTQDGECVTAADEPAQSPLLNTRSSLARAMYAVINENGIPDADRIVTVSGIIGRSIDSTKEMTEDEARMVLDALATQNGADQ